MNDIFVRQPAVAGQFYPSSEKSLRKQLSGFAQSKIAKQDAIACMLPHAGYIYSGEVAVETVSGINIKDNIVLLGPNHTGYGKKISVMSRGSWQTPLGNIKINTGLAKEILRLSDELEEDSLAHFREHSLEVELPILQYFKANFSIVPIAILSNEISILKKLGIVIANAIQNSDLNKATLIIASSDMTHYEPEKIAFEKDTAAINAILELNENKLIEKIRELDITMCGYAPAIAMITAAKALGAKNARLVRYQTSADVTGDKSSVVGYAGIVIQS